MEKEGEIVVFQGILPHVKLSLSRTEWRTCMARVTRGKTPLAKAKRRCLAALVYFVWQERNYRIFKLQSLGPDSVISKIRNFSDNNFGMFLIPSFVDGVLLQGWDSVAFLCGLFTEFYTLILGGWADCLALFFALYRGEDCRTNVAVLEENLMLRCSLCELDGMDKS
ncbi:hypothetical protein Dimus_035862 [Dionaea muscipula]